jgi:Terminase large subunit, T4likevirus-type, N-terminal
MAMGVIHDKLQAHQVPSIMAQSGLGFIDSCRFCCDLHEHSDSILGEEGSVKAKVDAQGQAFIEDFYNPFPHQKFLHRSTAKNLLGIGGNGSGKSFFLIGEAIYMASEYPGCNCLLIRRDYPELEKGLILDFKNTVPEDLYRYNDQKHVVTWCNGSKIFFGHLQNGSERTLSQYLSSAFPFIGIDELGQFSYNAYSFLSSRNRVNAGCQVNSDGYMPLTRMGAATNPLGPGYGWIKQLWIDKKPVSQLGELFQHKGKWYSRVTDKKLLENEDFRKHIEIIEGYSCICSYDPADYVFVHSTIMDNPAQVEKDPEYITKLAKLPPALKQKALYGDLNSIAGQYYSNFSYERHVLSLPRDSARIQWQSWQPIWMGIDWGLAHHTACYWFVRAQVQSALDMKWKSAIIMYRELVFNETGLKLGATKIHEAMPAEEVKRVRFIWLSPERFNRTADTDHTVAIEFGDYLHELGMPRPGRANDRRVDGAIFIYNLLEAEELYITESCPVFISALQTVVRDEKNLEDVLKTETQEDDCYDAGRYGLLSMLDPRHKPEELIHQEKLASIKDHTAKVFYAYEHMLKEEARNQPIRPRIVPRWMKDE